MKQSSGDGMAGGGEGAVALAMEHGARQKLLPMRSRRTRGLISLTFGEANDPRWASGGGLKFMVFNNGARPQLSFSSFRKQL
jgi:hypothetical protein